MNDTAALSTVEDMGSTAWECALVASARQKGFTARTEEVYRQWAARFVRFLGVRSPEQADEKDVGAFLTALAVQHHASRSAQKQALNAVVFLLREALKQPLKEIDFLRAEPRRNVRALWSRFEIDRLRRQLDGTTRLIVELVQRAGLRLHAALPLRVHDVDLARRRLHVSVGSGGKQRVALLPERLVAPLEEHIVRLRRLHALDRAAGLAAVRVPEGRGASLGAAGEAFEWQWLFPARQLAVDPATACKRRHHWTEAGFYRAVREAAMRAGISRRVPPQVLGQCVHEGDLAARGG